MYTILVTTNNEAIVSTPDQRIMQRSKLVDTLHILVAPTYNGISMSDCTVLMEYKLPVSQEARSEIKKIWNIHCLLIPISQRKLVMLRSNLLF